MHVFDVLIMLQSLVSNIYSVVTLDNVRSSHNFCSENVPQNLFLQLIRQIFLPTKFLSTRY